MANFSDRECTCGLPHDQATRLRILRRLLPCSSREIREVYPCLWEAAGRERPRGSSQREASSTLFRDLRALGAVKVEDQSEQHLGRLCQRWYLPEDVPACFRVGTLPPENLTKPETGAVSGGGGHASDVPA
jgi:hypothetical protein